MPSAISWRAIARIDMERRGYPLHILHEYRMDAEAVFGARQYRYYWEDRMESGFQEDEILQQTTPYDDPVSRRRWQFRMRTEYMAVAHAPGQGGDGTNVP